MPELDAPAAAPITTVRLASTIDADVLDHVGAQLDQLFHQRLLSYKARFDWPIKRDLLLRIIKWGAVLGLLASLGLSWIDGWDYRNGSMGPFLALCFSLLIPVTWGMHRLEHSQRYWMRLARRRARPLLKRARKCAPFIAEYQFRGDLVVYFRTAGARTELAWSRRMRGVRITGGGFTLLFKNERAFGPYAIFLHQPAPELDMLFDNLGISSIPAPMPGMQQNVPLMDGA